MRRTLVIVPIMAVLLLLVHWRPSRQVRLHQEHLFEAVASRDWKKVGKFVASDYSDRWQQTREKVLAHLPIAFRDFITCTIVSTDESLQWRDGACLSSARIRVIGKGGPMSQIVVDTFARLTGPFTLTWKRQSWKPWDWALASVDQPQLDVPPDSQFEEAQGLIP
ncbi:MAG: hypothetical protein ACREKL_02465 [Chthoniobacterales bacterium]